MATRLLTGSLIAYFLLPCLMYGQIPDSILKSKFSAFVRCRTEFTNRRVETGCGFIVRGQYLATCYHVIHPDPSYIIRKSYIVYNPRQSKTGIKYDTDYVDLSYKAKSGQYDFSKHIFDSTNRRTDFIVMKLQNKIEKFKYPLNAKYGGQTKQLFAVVGLLPDHESPKIKDCLYIGQSSQGQGKGFDFWECCADMSFGDSGSPLYDTLGKVIGITVSLSLTLADANVDKYADWHQILSYEYTIGNKLVTFLKSTYIIDHYLKGYLK